MPITKNEIKLFNLLNLKKYRQKYAFFIAEGEKIILDIFNSGLVPFKIFSTEYININFPFELISQKDLNYISSQKNPNKAIAIFKAPQTFLTITDDDFILALEQINDPGNLGSIIRLCDWFGVKNIICSENSVDCFNIKVVQSSMGSISRVNVHYLNLYDFLKNYKGDIFGSFLKGENISNISNIKKGILVMGNEANGISEEIESLITKKITITKSPNSKKIDSLNLAASTGIILHQIKNFDL